MPENTRKIKCLNRMKMVKEMEKGVFFATILKFQSNEVKKVTEKRDIYYQVNVMARCIN